MATNADHANLVTELQKANDAKWAALRKLSARTREAEQHAREADQIIQGAYAVLRDCGFFPDHAEQLADVIARAIKARVQPGLDLPARK